MTASLVAAYRKGAITADHLVVGCLESIDPEALGRALDALPPDLVIHVLDFARRSRAGRMVTNYGGLPTTEQVEAARRWIEANHLRDDPAPRPEVADRGDDRPGFPDVETMGTGPAPVGEARSI